MIITIYVNTVNTLPADDISFQGFGGYMKAAFWICSLISSSSLNGNVPLKLTYTITPTLHMSKDLLYPLFRRTSGAARNLRKINVLYIRCHNVTMCFAVIFVLGKHFTSFIIIRNNVTLHSALFLINGMFV